MALADLGLTTERLTSFDAALGEDSEPARVMAVDRTGLEIDMGRGPIRAELAGRLRHFTDSELDLPATGDWVAAREVDENALAIVSDVLPRTSILQRRRPGDRSEYQAIAANIDTAFILHSADQPVHRTRLERYLVMTRDGGIEPVIVISKADLISEDELNTSLEAAGRLAETLAVSSLNDNGAEAVRQRMEAKRTYALLGPSGVGKSTLLNALLGRQEFDTRAVREGDGKGRHTTTRRQLVRLESGAIVIDTPGMRELGMTDMQDGVDETFSDIAAWASECRFGDCSHDEEPGCRVREAVQKGELDEGRLASYLKLGREAAYYQRSYVEQRRKDKAQGKLYKSILQSKKDRR